VTEPTFLAPNKKVKKELRSLFEHVGKVNPYGGRVFSVGDVFAVIEKQFGPKVRKRCRIELTLH
jgi:hypothetical protein